MNLNVDVYLSSSDLFPIYKKLNNWNSGKVYLVVCGGLWWFVVVCWRFVVVCGRLLVVCGRL